MFFCWTFSSVSFRIIKFPSSGNTSIRSKLIIADVWSLEAGKLMYLIIASPVKNFIISCPQVTRLGLSNTEIKEEVTFDRFIRSSVAQTHVQIQSDRVIWPQSSLTQLKICEILRLDFYRTRKRLPAKSHVTPSFISARFGDAYVRRYTIPSLLQIMACSLFGTESLFEVTLSYCQLDPKDDMKFCLKIKSFYLGKCKWKCRRQNDSHFAQASIW